MVITLPNEVLYIIETLEKCGFEAYAVGGCVRDSLLGLTPQDWDVCTSALPEQTKECFTSHHIIDTGLKHGTITLRLNHLPFEITTYRVDGKYTDNRRPDNVRFVNVLKRDLARRDFTINAMAYNPKTGIVDYYGGQQDLADKRIKCVGNANKRFREDALRIMRTLRFAAVFGFCIEADTAQAMLDNRKLLGNIASERIATELNKFIVSDNVRKLVIAHFPVFAEIIPELGRLDGFAQNNPYHCFDVLTHTLVSIEAAPKDLTLRLAMLLHDIGKPQCHTVSEDGVSHFYGHCQISSDMARDILSRLKYDNDTKSTVIKLILYHDADIAPSGKSVKRWMGKIGENRLRQLLEVKRADAMAQSETYHQAKLDALGEVSRIVDDVIAQRQCFSLKDLAVDGRDLIDAGISEGAQIGMVLSRLVDMVIDEEVENDKAALLEVVARKFPQQLRERDYQRGEDEI